MTALRRTLVALSAGVLAVPLLLVGGGATASTSTASTSTASTQTGGTRTARAGAGPQDDHIKAAEAAVAWQRIAVRTIWTETVPAVAPPVGSMYLTFTSLAVHDAAREAQRRGRVAATAAVVTAAHDVLWEYFPASRANLDADLAATMARVPDGWKADTGAAIGAAAADEMIASRVGDGRFDATIVYQRAPAPGVWQPPATGMALAWLGFLRPVVAVDPVALDGPDPLTSAAYAADFREVASVGSATSTTRTADQTAISQFFAAPTVSAAYRLAVCDVVDSEPLGLLPTTRLFARIDASVLTSFIQTFRLKYDVGFWRPFQAIAGAATDGNPDTAPQTGWVGLLPTPAYSDYTSGHAAATAPFAEVVRQTFGDDTTLVLRIGSQTRTYTSVSALESDALESRIWGGLHFRDAMDDGYQLGHTTAQRVMAVIR